MMTHSHHETSHAHNDNIGNMLTDCEGEPTSSAVDEVSSKREGDECENLEIVISSSLMADLESCKLELHGVGRL